MQNNMVKTFYIDFGKTIAITKDNEIICLNPGAIRAIKYLYNKKQNIIINTKRIEFKNEKIVELIEFLKRYGLYLFKHYTISNEKLPPKNFDLSENIVYIDDKACDHLIKLKDVMVVDWDLILNDIINYFELKKKKS